MEIFFSFCARPGVANWVGWQRAVRLKLGNDPVILARTRGNATSLQPLFPKPNYGPERAAASYRGFAGSS